jgi:hypothetical protein
VTTDGEVQQRAPRARPVGWSCRPCANASRSAVR